MSDVTTNRDKLMAEVLWHVDAEVEKKGWDQDPGLFVVTIHRLTEELIAIALELMPGWDLCIKLGAHPIDALKAMGEVYRHAPVRFPNRDDPSELYGVAFVSEIWMLRSQKPFDAQTQRAIDEHRVDELPERIEARSIYCVSTRGEISVLTHERDGIAEAFDAKSGKLTGSIPRLLADLAKELR